MSNQNWGKPWLFSVWTWIWCPSRLRLGDEQQRQIVERHQTQIRECWIDPTIQPDNLLVNNVDIVSFIIMIVKSPRNVPNLNDFAFQNTITNKCFDISLQWFRIDWKRASRGSCNLIVMLNLFSLKEKKEEGGKGPATKKKASAAQLRITKVVDLLASNPLNISCLGH